MNNTKRWVKAGLASVFVLASLGVGTSFAQATDGFSQDPDNPTAVSEVPEGFEPSGDPVVSVVLDNCITQTTTVQTFSRTVVDTREVEKTREVEIPGEDAVTHQEFQYEREVPAVMGFRYKL